MSELNKHILLVMKWLDDKGSVSQDELIENRKAAYAAAGGAAYAAAAYAADAAYAAAAYAADADAAAEKWVDKYFERTGENKQDYIDAIEAEKVSSKKEPIQEWVDGLPPIGCECEIKYFHDNESKWAKCYVVGETKDNKCLVINVYHDDSLHFAFKKKGSLEFRPLKTQEQKDRETFIEWAKAGLHLNIDDMGAAFKVVEQLADNGAKAPAGE